MASNIIDETKPIPQKEIRQLPDRSDLSGLYFETNKGYQKGSINFESGGESSHEHYMKFLNKNYAKIGVLLPLPISVAIFLYGFISDSDLVKQNPMIALPIIIVSTAVAIAVMAISYKIIKNILEKLGIVSSYFFIYLLLCMGLIYAPAFFISSFVPGNLLVHLWAYIFVSVFCVLITKILLVAIGDEQINSRVRTVMRGAGLAICLGVAVIFSLYLF
jgi:hypothetical protein